METTTDPFDDDLGDLDYDLDLDLDHDYEGLDTYEDYEPSPYDGTYSEE